MRAENLEEVQYYLPLYNNLEKGTEVHLNPYIGKKICLQFTGNINCVVTGKKIKKTYGEGMSYDAFMSSPMADESIIRPELSTAHLGIERRDLDWEIKNHVVPHYVYLAYTGGFKVGVTRYTQIPTRWIDQGATKAVKIAETPYRQAAGLIEVALKEYIADKTNWRNMLKGSEEPGQDILDIRSDMLRHIPEDLKDYALNDAKVMDLNFPVQQYPEKPKSVKFDKLPVIEKTLVGIKGQYLIFEDQSVLNIRSHTAYEIMFES
jgi:hypothetical protein